MINLLYFVIPSRENIEVVKLNSWMGYLIMIVVGGGRGYCAKTVF